MHFKVGILQSEASPGELIQDIAESETGNDSRTNASESPSSLVISQTEDVSVSKNLVIKAPNKQQEHQQQELLAQQTAQLRTSPQQYARSMLPMPNAASVSPSCLGPFHILSQPQPQPPVLVHTPAQLFPEQKVATPQAPQSTPLGEPAQSKLLHNQDAHNALR